MGAADLAGDLCIEAREVEMAQLEWVLGGPRKRVRAEPRGVGTQEWEE